MPTLTATKSSIQVWQERLDLLNNLLIEEQALAAPSSIYISDLQDSITQCKRYLAMKNKSFLKSK